MQDCKSPENDGFTKKFYEYISNVIKDPLMNSIKEPRKDKKLSISQPQERKKGQRQTLHKELAFNFSS